MLVAIVVRVLSTMLRAIAAAPSRLRISRQVLRFTVLVTVLAALMLLPIRFSPQTATVASIALLAIGCVFAIGTAAAARALLAKLVDVGNGSIELLGGRVQLDVPLIDRQVRALEGSMRLVKRAGIAIPALAFFCLWALVYLLIWARSPGVCPADPATTCNAAFWGAGAHPTFGDFLYYAVNMAFANPVPDLIARSRVAHTAATIEVISGVGLVTLYAGSFFGLRTTTSEPAPGDVPTPS